MSWLRVLRWKPWPSGAPTSASRVCLGHGRFFSLVLMFCLIVETVLMQDANLDALLQVICPNSVAFASRYSLDVVSARRPDFCRRWQAVSSSHTQATLPSLLQGLGHLLSASTALTKVRSCAACVPELTFVRFS
jgi:hypothetical protein